MLSENIKNIRISKGLSQGQLAAKLNVVRQTVSKWEKGLSVPDSEMLIKLSACLETPVSALLGDALPPADAADKGDEKEAVKELSEKLEIINAQLARSAERRRKAVRVISIAALIASLLLIAVFAFPQIGIGSGVGVIGGADGPTAIFVAQKVNLAPLIITVTILLLAALIGIFLSRKKH